MKTLILSTLWICSLGMASAQTALTETDRELLLERLKKIQESSNEKVQGRYSVAVSAFSSAAGSDAAALALFLKCSEKVKFTDQAKKAQDFREWKRDEKRTHDDPGFKRALRHQLLWLLTTIEIAGNPNARKTMPDKAVAALAAIFRDAEVLDRYKGILEKDVLESVFAQAYELDKLSVENWPKGPLVIEGMYEHIIMKPLRTKATISKLKDAWSDRIKHEGLARQLWGAEGTAGRDRKPDFENWMIKGRLDLVWNMEIDLYSAGDEKAAALRMLDHLKDNLSHSSAPQWIIEFTNVINGNPARPVEDSTTNK